MRFIQIYYFTFNHFCLLFKISLPTFSTNRHSAIYFISIAKSSPQSFIHFGLGGANRRFGLTGHLGCLAFGPGRRQETEALALAQTAVYLATAPKSNAVYKAYTKAKEDVVSNRTPSVPFHIRNAPTRLMAELGFGEGYEYPHDHPDAVTEQDYLPGELKGTRYYEPTGRGYEAKIKARLDRWRKILAQRKGKPK